jgi:hypothetical protein
MKQYRHRVAATASALESLRYDIIPITSDYDTEIHKSQHSLLPPATSRPHR